MLAGKNKTGLLILSALLVLVWVPSLPAANLKQQTGSISEECANKLASLEEELYAAAKCEKDEDCVEVYIGCPFGCGTALRDGFNLDVFDVKKKMYENECGGCAYRCANEQKELMCATGRCRLIYHSEIEQWRQEERDAKERERQEYLDSKDERLKHP